MQVYKQISIMKTKISLLTVLVISLSLNSLALFAQQSDDVASDFTLDLLDGGQFTLFDHSGDVILLYFFGNTCGGCISTAPQIENQVFQRFKNTDKLTIVGVDTWDGPPKSVEAFREATGVTIPLLMMGSSVTVQFGVSFDRFLVIDSTGTIVYRGSSAAGVNIDYVNKILTEQLGLTELPTRLVTLNQESNVLYNYPNPFVNVTNIAFNLLQEGNVGIVLYDLSGKPITKVNYGKKLPGFQSVSFNDISVSPGIYVYKLILNDKVYKTANMSVQ